MWQRDGINLIYQRSFHKLHQRIIKANNIIPQYNEIVSQFSNRLDHSSSLSAAHTLFLPFPPTKINHIENALDVRQSVSVR